MTAPGRWLGGHVRRLKGRGDTVLKKGTGSEPANASPTTNACREVPVPLLHEGESGRYPRRDADYYQDQHDNVAAYHENNWLLEQFSLIAELPGASIAEFGCGNGRFLERAASHFARVYGFDWAESRHLREVLERHPNVSFEKRDLVHDAPDVATDIAASADFLEHLMPEDAERVVRHMHRCAPLNFHIIACYDDTHSHQTVLSSADWLRLFQRLSPDYYVLCEWLREGNAAKAVCVVTNYPPPGAARRSFLARVAKRE